MKALSFRQPWVDSILNGGKRIENRVHWRSSNFRGEFLIHASKGMTKQEYIDVGVFVTERNIVWRPPPVDKLTFGAIVGRATVVGVISETAGIVEPHHEPWWMGAFALLLDDVVAFPEPIPHSGALGFFNTPYDREGVRT